MAGGKTEIPRCIISLSTCYGAEGTACGVAAAAANNSVICGLIVQAPSHRAVIARDPISLSSVPPACNGPTDHPSLCQVTTEPPDHVRGGAGFQAESWNRAELAGGVHRDQLPAGHTRAVNAGGKRVGVSARIADADGLVVAARPGVADLDGVGAVGDVRT